MPSLHKRSRSPYWIASFRADDGRWLKKSTKTADRAKAMKIAVEWENAAKDAMAGMLIEGQARKVIAEIVERSSGRQMQFYSCEDWLREWLAGKQGVTTKHTAEKYRQVVDDFLVFVGTRAKSPLGAITLADMREFRIALMESGLSPTTINQNIKKVLSAAFTAAVRMGYILSNPCAGLESLKVKDDTTRDVFTAEQVLALYSAAEGDWQGVILAGYCTGLRLGDITNLTWDAIDLKAGTLKTKTRKTGANVLVPLSSDLVYWLSAQPKGKRDAPVFPSLAGKASSGRSGLSMKFSRIMEAAGIESRILRERKEGTQGRTQRSLTFHSLRHSFNSALANAGVAQEVRQKLTGHTTAAMNNRYTHHEVETLRAAMDKLPGIMPSTARE